MKAKRWGIAAVATLIVVGSAVIGTPAAHADGAGPTVTTVACTPAPLTAGQTLSCVVTVGDAQTGEAVPDGWAEVRLAGDSLSGDGWCFVTSGTCTLPFLFPSTWRGSVAVTATYQGDSAYLPSSGTTQVIVLEPTALVAKPAIANLVSPTAVYLTLAARLTDPNQRIPLVGATVRFAANGTTLCSGVTDATGMATCSSLTSVAQAADGYKAFFDGEDYRMRASASGSGVRL